MALKTKDLDQVRPEVQKLATAAAKGELVRINFLVPAEVRIAWKKLAIDRGQTMQDLIIESMNQHFKTSKSL